MTVDAIEDIEIKTKFTVRAHTHACFLLLRAVVGVTTYVQMTVHAYEAGCGWLPPDTRFSPEFTTGVLAV